MLGLNSIVEPGICEVHTTEHRGFTSEEIAKRSVGKIVSIAESEAMLFLQQSFPFHLGYHISRNFL